METLALPIPFARIESFCRHWRVQELDVFGSVVREDFGPESDVDVLIAFAPDARPSLFDLVTMQDELEAIFGRPVDLLEREAVEVNHNWIRREAILQSARPVYRAA
jgi:uncharacterized protein